MRNASVAWFLGMSLVACSSSSPSLDGTWEYLADDSTGAGLTLRSNGTYTASELVLTGSSSAEAQIQTGTYEVDATQLKFTPEQWSCAEAAPTFTADYVLTSSTLSISTPSGIIVYTPDTQASGNIAITDGCFSANGTFTASPLAAVTK